MIKPQILITDDEEVNRELLKNMFSFDGNEYDLLEAEDGEEAIFQLEANHNIVLVLLDVVMPIMDGFEVLEYMRKKDLIDKIPVILITAEAVVDTEGEAYSYGVADVIHKPFYPTIVKRRSKNIIELYQNKQNMERRLKEQEKQIREQEQEIRRSSEYMMDALCSVLECRSAETGDHVKRIKYFTKTILNCLMKNYPKYGLTPEKVDVISRASALHDVGKIGIPDNILLKPGRLTSEEFEIIKSHTTIGCDILEKVREGQDEEFYNYCYEICRHHHERWDGKGYPDHLAGDDIPISAQAVAIADVYDALISPRVYKSSYTNDVAFQMIMNGECGEFSPDILKCFEITKDDFFNILEMLKVFELL